MAEFRDNIWSTKRPSIDHIPQLWDNEEINVNYNQQPQTDFIARRHSYLGVGMTPDIDSKLTLNMINDYFTKDPHNRIKVTLDLLDQRFFDEEKYLSDNYQLPKFPIENSLRNYQLVLVGFKAGRIDVFYLPLDNQLLLGLQVGDLVIVEADRGRDLGKIFKMNISIDEARLMKLLQFQEQQSALSETLGQNDDLSVKQMSESSTNSPSSPNQNSGSNANVSATQPPTLHFPKPILSLAQPNEILQILNKNQDEEKACRLCLAKIANATGFPNLPSPTSSPSSMNANSDLLQMKLIDAEYQFDRKKLIFYYSTSKRIDFRDLVRELFRIYKTRIWMCAVTGLPYVPNANSGMTKKSFPNLAFNNDGNAIQNTNFNNAFGASNSNYLPTRYTMPAYQSTGIPVQQQMPMNMYSTMNNDLIQVPRRFMADDYYNNSQPPPHLQQHSRRSSLQNQPVAPVAPVAPISQINMPTNYQPQLQQQSQSHSQPLYPLPNNNFKLYSSNDANQANIDNSQRHFFQQFHQMLNTNNGTQLKQDNDPKSNIKKNESEIYKNLDSSSATLSSETFVLKSLVDSINH